MKRALLVTALLVLPAVAAGQEAAAPTAPTAAPTLAPPRRLATQAPAYDNGTHLILTFRPPAAPATHFEIWRTAAEDVDLAAQPDLDKGGWKQVTRLAAEAPAEAPADAPDRKDEYVYKDEVEPGKSYTYAVRSVTVPAGTTLTPDAPLPAGAAISPFVVTGPERPVSSWFDASRWFTLLMVLAMLALLGIYLQRARRGGKKMYVRRIPGIDAMEEAIGRSTEMGRPVLYIPGIDDIQNIQTVAGLLILGSVAEMVARYDTQIRVPCVYPMNMVIAEEIVRQGFYNAGRPDAHRPQNIQYISSEQFAFCAGVVGIINREKPATNIYLGRFFAESLILAEAGHANRSIQIGGTAEITQLPFFIAACDYTIIGEELFAVSAYLSRDPRELSMLKATDTFKVGLMALILIGAVLATLPYVGFSLSSFLGL